MTSSLFINELLLSFSSRTFPAFGQSGLWIKNKALLGLIFLEIQANRIDAISLAGRLGAIVEYMTQMRPASRAKYFSTLPA